MSNWTYLQACLALVAVFQVPVDAVVDLCPYYQNMSYPNHTTCLTKTDTTGLSDADKNTILTNHNDARANVAPSATNMLKMRWDDQLADTAQRWAETCPGGHDTNGNRSHHGEIGPVGQNIAYSDGVMTWASACQLWIYEQAFFDYDSYPIPTVAGEIIGHYSQVIWADSYLIGCGWKTDCSTGWQSVLVCNYGPAGNWVGQKPYTNGTTCGACPSTQEGNLCNCTSAYCRQGNTLNPNTCTCNCKGRFQTDSSECKYNCTVEDHSDCSTKWSNTENCVYSNVKYEYCAHNCDVCPAYANIP